MSGRLLVVLCAALMIPLAAGPVAASKPAAVSFDTHKALGPGTVDPWSSTGAFGASGTFETLALHFSASNAPDFQLTHVTYRFGAAGGSFEVHADMKGAADNPDILFSDDTWNIQCGPGVSARPHGSGTVTGTIDETHPSNRHGDRVYSGEVHFD